MTKKTTPNQYKQCQMVIATTHKNLSEMGFTTSAIAKIMGISRETLYQKYIGKKS